MLQVRLTQRQTRRTAIDDTADRRPMALTEAGDDEGTAYAVA
jgi:hypothetical protein